MNDERIGFVGSGVMAEVMINGLLTRKVVAPERIWASGPRQERAAQLSERYGIRATTDNLEAVAGADIVVLAVKPQTLAKVLREVKPAIRHEHLVMSIIAGARMATIGGALGDAAYKRSVEMGTRLEEQVKA